MTHKNFLFFLACFCIAQGAGAYDTESTEVPYNTKKPGLQLGQKQVAVIAGSSLGLGVLANILLPDQGEEEDSNASPVKKGDSTSQVKGDPRQGDTAVTQRVSRRKGASSKAEKATRLGKGIYVPEAKKKGLLRAGNYLETVEEESSQSESGPEVRDKIGTKWAHTGGQEQEELEVLEEKVREAAERELE